MKRMLVFILALALLFSCGAAGAEVISLTGSSSEKIKPGSEIMIDEVCTFTVHSVKEYDVFMNIPSGDDKQLLVVSFDFMNLMPDQLFLKTQMDANLCYDDSFDFEPAHLWAEPQGYFVYSGDASQTLTILGINDDSSLQFYCTGSYMPVFEGGFETPVLNYGGGQNYFFIPDENVFRHTESRYFSSQDASKTVFDPLVERTMFYVFQVPEIVAEDEGLRELTLTVDGEEFYLIF